MENTAVHDIENTLEIEFSTEIIASPYSIETHFHKNPEIIAVEKGSCTVELNGNSYCVSEGQVIIILPFRIHAVSVPKNSRIRRSTASQNLWLAFIDGIQNKVPASPVFAPTEETFYYYTHVMTREFGEERTKYVRFTKPHATRILAKSLMYLIGAEFITSAEFIPDASETNSCYMIEKMAKYITDNFKNDISLVTMAKEFGYNPQYLSRKLNNAFNINFKKLLNQHRINHAFCLMLDTTLPYSEIASESGFQSIRSFNQICLDTFGKTPKELRTQYSQRSTDSY